MAWAASLAAVLLSLLLTGTIAADNSIVVQLPNTMPRPGQPPRPWKIQVDPSGIDGEAYRGVKITVTERTNTPVTADHSLRVVIYGNGSESYYDERVTAFIVVPEGKASATAIVDVPQRQQWMQIHVEFHEDGEPLDGCSTYFGLPRMGPRNWGDDSAGVLVIDSDAPTRDQYRALMGTITSAKSPVKGLRQLPDVRWLVAAIPANQVASNAQVLTYTSESYDDAQLLQTFSTHEGVDLLPPEELSSSWLSHSNADLTVISLADLRMLNSQSPERHEALLRWTMAGGSLVVCGCGDRWENLGEICRLVGIAHDGKKPGESSSWQLPPQHKFHPEVEGVFDANRPQTYEAYEMSGAKPQPVPPMPLPNISSGSSPFALRRLGLGTVVAYRSNDPFPGTPQDWGGLWNSIGAQQFLWSRRHGLSHQRQNADFWNFVIPGVGEAPVFSFMTMIALFMLLIGPVNYYYLNRWRRLSLLLVTVPLGAGIFTLGLFLFAVLSDGFATRSRVRSFTVLEPGGGRAATISRQTYYTAFVPSDGMHYPPDTAVYPLHYAPYDESDGRFYQTDSQWLDGKLQLQRRYLTAREHRQFVIVRSTASKARLDVTAAGNTLRVKNLLGTKLEYGLLFDDAGRLHAVENLESDATTDAQAITAAAARTQWGNHLGPKTPRMPHDFDPTRLDTMFSRQRYYNYGYYGGGQNSPWQPSQSNSALERGIRELDSLLMQPEGKRAGSGSGAERSFFVITTDSITAEDGQAMAPLGIRGSRVVESLHVVRGRW